MFEAFMPQAQDPNVAGPSLEELRKRKLMAELLQGRRGPPKIEHPLQGVAHILDSAFDGMRDKRERQRSQAEATQANQMMAQFLAGAGGPTAPSAAPASPAPTAPSATGTAPAAPTASPASLIQSESGGDWGARNSVPRRDGTVGHFGRLQFSQPRIAEAAAAGAIPQGTTPQAFMASPELQQAAERWHFADIDRNIVERGLDRYVGQTINGVPVTLEGMRAVAHLGGNQGLARFLETGGRYNPQDSNGTSLLNYLQRHGSQRRAEAPADTLTGSDGMEAPPLVDGRNLPSDTQAPALDRPAMSFDEAMPPADPAPPAPIAAGPDPQALAQVLFSAPVPEPRPPTPAPSVDNMMAGDQVAPQGAPMQAPMPQPRPNLEPPPQAMPAGPAPQPPPQAIAQALAPQMNERDRLMMLRDEQSLAPGEADRLRQGLANPQALAAVLQGRPAPMATPAPAPAPMPAQQPPQPQGMPQQMQAPMPPGATPQGAPQIQAPGQPDRALLARMMQNPQTRPFAMQIIQQQMAQSTPQAQAALQKAQAEAAIAQRNATAPQNQIMTAPDGSIISVDPRSNQSTTVREAARPPMIVPPGASVINPQTREVLHTAPKEMSSADKKAIMDAEDQIPVLGNTVEALRRARELNAQAYSGVTAGALTSIGTSGIPGAGMIADPERAKASREFNQIMSGQAIESMSNILKGATTDREMAQFREILGNPSTPPDIRQRTIDRMLQLAERQMTLQQDRVRQLRGGDYFRPGQTPGQPPAPQAAPQPSPAAPTAVPQPGEVRRGYRYKGGDPSQQSSWERAQ